MANPVRVGDHLLQRLGQSFSGMPLRTVGGADRDFWRSHPVGIGEFADRFTGSADLYATVDPSGLPPQALPRRRRGLRAALVHPREHADGRVPNGADPNARAPAIYLGGRDAPVRAEDGMSCRVTDSWS